MSTADLPPGAADAYMAETAEGRELTVFVISCDNGDPNLSDCLEALGHQDIPVHIERIHNVAPMDRAFQEMLTRCQTPYFIQADQDMVLEPHAVSTMLDDIRSQPENVAIVAYMLRDVHLDFPIHGVKIYRHAAVSQFPYQDGMSCEMGQMERLKAAGYVMETRETVLGEHSPQWTEELIFERYFDLMEKWKRFGYPWLENMPHQLLASYLNSQDEMDLYAFLGAWASASRPERLRHREKDFRVRTREYLTARGWLRLPLEATLFMTDQCNLKCPWCMRQGTMVSIPESPPMSVEVVKTIISRFPSIRSFCLCGFGETLLHPNLPDIIDLLRAHGCWCNLITNGVLLEQALPTLLDHRPDSIGISLNAATPEEHAAECGVPGAWFRVMAGIQAMRDARRKFQDAHSYDTGIPLYLSRVCTAQNLHGVQAFLELAKGLEIVAGVDLHNILPHDVGTPEKEEAFLETVLTREHAAAIDALRWLPGKELVRSWPVPIDPQSPVRHCDCSFRTLAVDGKGNISVCSSVMPPDPANGSLASPRVWQGTYAQDHRAQFAKPELPAWCRYCFRNWAPQGE